MDIYFHECPHDTKLVRVDIDFWTLIDAVNHCWPFVCHLCVLITSYIWERSGFVLIQITLKPNAASGGILAHIWGRSVPRSSGKFLHTPRPCGPSLWFQRIGFCACNDTCNSIRYFYVVCWLLIRPWLCLINWAFWRMVLLTATAMTSKNHVFLLLWQPLEVTRWRMCAMCWLNTGSTMQARITLHPELPGEWVMQAISRILDVFFRLLNFHLFIFSE